MCKMKRIPYFVLWMFIAVLCFSVISIPILAADRGSTEPDAVAGARSGLFTLASGKSGGTHDIHVSPLKNGSVTPSVSGGLPGKNITFDIQPDAGYETASIAVITAGGDELPVSLDGGIYRFTMPNQAVVVDVTFQLKRI